MSIEERTNAVLEKIESMKVTEERIVALEKTDASLKEENTMLTAQVSALSDQMDFYEECIVEMAEVVYA